MLNDLFSDDVIFGFGQNVVLQFVFFDLNIQCFLIHNTSETSKHVFQLLPLILCMPKYFI